MDAGKIFKTKLVGSMAILAALGLTLMFIIINTVQQQVQLAAALAGLIIALFALAFFFFMFMARQEEKRIAMDILYSFVDSVPVVCSLVDNNANLLYCNEEAPKMFGLQDRKEYMEKWLYIMPEFQPNGRASQDLAEEVIKTAFEQGKINLELMQRKPNTNEPIQNDVTLVRINFLGADYLLEYTRDLSDSREKKKEAALKERMQAILDSAPLLCAVYDEHGNVVEVNKEAEHLFGISNRQIFIDNYNSFMPEYQPDGSHSTTKNAELMKQAIREGYCRYEWMYQSRDGKPIPTDDVMQRITIDGRNLVISYSRDLREFYKNKEKDELVQQNIHTMMEQLNGNVTEQAAAVSQSAAAIEEMVANIQSVTVALSKNADHANDLHSASEVGHTSINEVVSDIREIANQSASLLEINSVMENIASQTNLLSMNAAIEAAHAGEYGRGFAVVAGEIRKLSESSSQQSKTTSAALKKIKGAIDKITRSTENVLKKFNAIDEGIKTVTEQERGVLNAMEEQKQGSQQVLLAMGQLSDITERVKSDAQQMVKRHEENFA